MNLLALPPDGGFGLFSAAHLAVLCGIILLCAVCIIRLRRSSAATQRRAALLLSGTALLLEIIRVSVFCITGCMNIGLLPLHLCGLAVYLCVIFSWIPADWLGQTLYALCLPGACAALLFPDWSCYALSSFVSVTSFAIHTSVVLYILLQTACGAIRPRLRAIYKPIAFLCVVVPPIALFNRTFGTNYMFLQTPSAGSPLVLLYELAGERYIGYLLLYAIVIGIVMTAMLLPFSRRNKPHAKTGQL